MKVKAEAEIFISRRKYCSKGRNCVHSVCQKARRDEKKRIKEELNNGGA